MTQTATVYHGDCLDLMPQILASNSIDACVTDPPYGLSSHSQKDAVDCLTAWVSGKPYTPNKKGFMGRGWDAWVPGPEVWREVYRVLKPGGHCLVFAGTRSMDLMMMALRLAGFEIRDAIGHAYGEGDPQQAGVMAWAYGSGFPKNMNVGAAIDKLDGVEGARNRALRFTEYMRSAGLTSAFLDAVTSSCMGGHYLTASSQPAIPVKAHFDLIRPFLPAPIPEWVEEFVHARTVESENFKAREVIGVNKGAAAGWDMDGGTQFVDRNITRAHTPEAKEWEGWGTSLKPAWEPIIIARKPLIGTVADNVLAHRTGAINVDGCRVGRFPANLIHDGSPEVMALFPDSDGSGGSVPNVKVTGYGEGVVGSGSSEYLGGERTKVNAGSGSAGRFFYSAKASKKDREEGNIHPTVKPTALMQYLCRLVTPPGGTIVDPFTGSGSTGKGAVIEGFNFVGFELGLDYVHIARNRINHARRTTQ